MKKLLYIFGLVAMAILGYGFYWLDSAIPVGTGYASKYVCSQVFLANRDSKIVFENDVKPTNPLFLIIGTKVDYDKKTVTAKGLGFWRPATAVYREGCGCTLEVDTTREELLEQAKGTILQSKASQEMVLFQWNYQHNSQNCKRHGWWYFSQF